MERIVEPELMSGAEQAQAYADANFEEAHSRYPLLFREKFPNVTRLDGIWPRRYDGDPAMTRLLTK